MRKGQQRMKWHHGHEFEQLLEVSDGQGSLVCSSPWGHKESDTTETELNWYPKITNMLTQNLQTNVNSSIISNSYKVETTLMSINWRTDKQNVINPYTGILFSNKKEWGTNSSYSMDDPYSMDDSFTLAQWKLDTKGHTLHDSIYMKYP